jgi:arylsulfatase A-like enzyme
MHPGIQGKSLWPILSGQASPDFHRDSIYSEYYNAQPWHPDNPPQCTMVFDGRYKLVRVHSTREGELYDLEQDPTETDNLYESPAHIVEKLRMLELLSDRMAWTVDPLPARLAQF